MIQLQGAVYPVRDLKRAARWYQEWLECSPAAEGRSEVRFETATGELLLVELVDGRPERNPASCGARWQTADVRAAWERLLKLGADEVEAPRMREDGVWVGIACDPFGNRLNLVEGAGAQGPLRIAASGESSRAIEVERIISAPRTRVWRAWTRQEELGAWFGSDAHVELRVGGPFEIYMLAEPAGLRGSEGCRVLSYLEERMLSFSWNAPPDHSTRDWQTRVVVELSDIDSVKAVTRVRLTHTGWPRATGDEAQNDAAPGEPDAAEWDATFAYFQRAWPRVMTSLERHLSRATGHH
ncbi:SRPBCC domain-containing protein [Lujinxingia vulgaris]|nr:SRPBCC domain-containing protein [Lujinxingia vulgaris]